MKYPIDFYTYRVTYHNLCNCAEDDILGVCFTKIENQQNRKRYGIHDARFHPAHVHISLKVVDINSGKNSHNDKGIFAFVALATAAQDSINSTSDPPDAAGCVYHM